MKLPTELQPSIKQLESCEKPFTDFRVVDVIRAKIREVEQAEQPITIEMEAEWMAFAFMADYQQGRNKWGTYFGPMMEGKTKDGQIVQSPSIQRISGPVLDYWRERSSETAHPFFRARYSDLVWDFSKPVTQKAADVKFAQRAIDSYLELISKSHYEHINASITDAKRALDLAISINDSARIESARDAILELEAKICEVKMPGTWGFTFDLLINNAKSKLTESQRQTIINRLESILSKVATAADSEDTIDPFVGERAALRLARYYRRLEKLDEARRVLKLYAKPFVVLSKKAGPMLAHSWLRQVHQNFCEYGMKEDAELLAVQIRELGIESKKDMREFSQKIEVPVAEVESFINQLLAGDLEQALGRVATYFTPDSKKVEQQVKDLAKVAPLMSFLSTNIVGNDGRDVAMVGSVDDDLEGRVVLQMAQNFQIEGLFLRQALEKFIKRFGLSVDSLLDQLYKSPLFDENRRTILKKGLEAFYSGDHATTVHLIIPQIEHAFRRLLVKCQRPIFKLNRQGGQDLRILDEMLRDPAVTQLFSESKTVYLRVLLTDRRGWNLRNDICHGITEPESIGWPSSDRVIHVLLILSCIRQRETNG